MCGESGLTSWWTTARVIERRPLLYLGSANAFLVGIWFITGGVLGGVAVARFGKTLRLRTILAAVAVVGVLLGVVRGHESSRADSC
jgi:ABC-type thiamin/hydroxymethylpyrimidine transport system permease subunit